MKFLFGLLLALAPIVLGQINIDAVIDGVYDALDDNYDGSLLRPEIDSFFRNYDANHDTYINNAEYTTAVDENFAHDQDLTRLYKNLFDVLDTDKDGRISHHDLDVIFGRADANRNNVVTRAEFHTYFYGIALQLLLG